MSEKTKSPKPILWIGSPKGFNFNDECIFDDYHIIEYPADNCSIEIVSESNPLAISEAPEDKAGDIGNYKKSAKEVLEIYDILGCKSIFSLDSIDLLSQEVKFRSSPNTEHTISTSKENIKKVCNYVANYYPYSLL